MARPKRMAAATAQCQKQATISSTESLELVRCLMRVSIFHLSYLRGLFPEKNFKGVDMKNLDGMHIKMLTPACEESQRLIEWIETGVYDAVKKGYAKNLFFGVSTDIDGTNLLEEYIFSFTYGSDGTAVNMDFMTGYKGRKPPKKKFPSQASITSLRYQVCRLMRMLVQVCQTLDKVPNELTYHDHTPDEYEPPKFVAIGDRSEMGYFARQPFSMNVGNVTTEHHTVSVKVKSILDECEEDTDAEVDKELVYSMQHSTTISMSIDKGFTDDVGNNVAINQENENEKCGNETVDSGNVALAAGQVHFSDSLTNSGMDPKNKAGCLKVPPTQEPLTRNADMGARKEYEAKTAETLLTAEEEQDYLKVEDFCVRRPTIDLTDAMARFMEMPLHLLEKYFEVMVERKVLKTTDKGDVYQVMDPKQIKMTRSAGRNNLKGNIMERMTSLAIDKADLPQGPKDFVPKSMQETQDAEMRLTPGDEGTQSVHHTSKMDVTMLDKAAAPIASGANKNGHDAEKVPKSQYFEDSQQTKASGRARKASYVSSPIHQLWRNKRSCTLATTRNSDL